MSYKINLYGDSVLKGIVYDNDRKKYVPGHGNALTAVKDTFGMEINNYSKFGATVKDIKKLIELDFQKGYGCDYLVIETGGNDCDHDWAAVAEDPSGRHFPKVPLSEYVSELTSLIFFVKEHGIIPLVANIPPIDSEKYLDHICRNGLDKSRILQWLGGDCQQISRRQELYSEANCRVATAAGVDLIDCRSLFLSRKNYGSLMCDDGIHPNKKGQTVIAASFYRFIRSFLSEKK